MSTPQLIDLARVRDNGTTHIFAGRDKGKHWRVVFRIDELDTADGPVNVQVPDDVYLISPSFFLSLFGVSVRRLGMSRFHEKYRFLGSEDIQMQVEKGIALALKTSIGLPETK